MDTEKKLDYLLKFLTPILTLTTVAIGIYQFNKGQRINKEKEIEQSKREAASRSYQMNMQVLSKFKENQQKVYSETMSVVGYLANNTAENSTQKYTDSYNRFYQLYWVELAPVESAELDTALLYFKNILDDLRRNNFRNIEDKELDLELKANDVAGAISRSLRDWKLPGGLTGLDTTTNY